MKGHSKQLFFGLLIILVTAALYRPLPNNFTDSLGERLLMQIIEVMLRFVYVYPTRLCTNPSCELAWMRFALDKLMLAVGPWSMKDPEMEITDFESGSIPVRVYVPNNRSNNGAIIYIHGGGFVLGTRNMYESVIRRMARTSKMVTFSFDYRLAPEHVFPAALDDCEQFVLTVLNETYQDYGIDRSRIALVGDSAGAGLIASLAYRLRHRHDIVQPKLQVLIYPLVQIHHLRTPSYEYYRREMRDTGFVEPRLIAQFYLMYAGVNGKTNEMMTRQVLDNQHLSKRARLNLEDYIDLNDIPEELRYDRNTTAWHGNYDENTSRRLTPYLFNPEFAPIVQSNLSNAPRALVVTMEHDVLRDEGILYAAKLRQAGVPTTWKHFTTGFHAMINFHDIIKTSGNVVEYISEWTRDNV